MCVFEEQKKQKRSLHGQTKQQALIQPRTPQLVSQSPLRHQAAKIHRE